MGGLWSALTDAFTEAKPPPITRYSSGQNRLSANSYRANHTLIESNRTSTLEQQLMPRIISSAPVQNTRKIPCVPTYRSLGYMILQQHLWTPMPSNQEYMRVEIPEYSSEYIKLKDLFKATTQKHFKVTKIEHVHNPYLLGCYMLKKHEMQVIYGNVTERYAFHGTKKCNVESICRNNFNWRLHGKSVGNRFGKGVSFSPISCYASNYSDENCEEKIMFLAKILYCKAVKGDGKMTLPPRFGLGSTRYDTAAKEDGSVLVKFCDNEYYPEYLIYYTGSYINNKTRNQNRKVDKCYHSFY